MNKSALHLMLVIGLLVISTSNNMCCAKSWTDLRYSQAKPQIVKDLLQELNDDIVAESFNDYPPDY
uniref:Uncharacterized protein n=1 Tax=Ciona intestinalis TaxID=7719 RepID=F6UJF8_CIOIN